MRPDTEWNSHPPEQPTTQQRGNARTAVIDSRALFGHAELLHINHQGLTYTLRKTRNGKLILTK
jgi:hemin uptake protein HemP